MKKINFQIIGLLILCVLATFSLACSETAQNVAVKSKGDVKKQWSSLMSKIRLYNKKNDYKSAIKNAKLLLEVAKNNYDENHIKRIHALAILGQFYEATAKYDKAEQLFVKCLKLSEKVIGKNKYDTATARNNLAMTYEDLHKFKKAKALFDETLKIFKASNMQKNPEVFKAMTGLGLMLKAQGKYKKSEVLLKKVVELKRTTSGITKKSINKSMYYLALTYAIMGRHSEAKPIFKQCLEYAKKTSGYTNSLTQQIMSSLALEYEFESKYSEAEALQRKSLKFTRLTLGDQHPATLASMNYLSIILYSSGKYQEAEFLLKQCLKTDLSILGAKDTTRLNAMNNLALVYCAQGRFTEAELLYKKTLELQKEVLGDKHPEVIITLGNLANLYYTTSNYRKAEPIFLKCYKLTKTVLGTKHPLTLAAMNSLGYIYLCLKKYDKSEPLLKKCLQLKNNILGERNISTLNTLNNLGLLYDSQKKYDKAEPLLKKCLELTQKTLGEFHPGTLISLNNLARFYASESKYSKAAPIFKMSLKETNKFLETVLWGASESTRQSYLNLQAVPRDLFLSFVTKYNTSEMAKEALLYSLTRKGILYRISSEINAVTNATKVPALKKIALKLKNKEEIISTLAFSGPGEKDPGTFHEKIKKIRENIKELEEKLGKAVHKLKRANTDIYPNDVVNSLNKNEALVDFLVFNKFDFKSSLFGEQQVIAIVVDKTKQEAVKIVDLGNLKPITELIKIYRSKIQAHASLSELKKTGKKLYNAIWEPIFSHVGKKGTLYVVPDGYLHFLPFAAITDQTGKYLIEKIQLKYLSSSRDLVLEPLVGSSTKSLIFADPQFSKKSSSSLSDNKKRGLITTANSLRNLNFTQLPGALAEGESIYQLFKSKKLPVKLFLKKEADENTLKKAVSPKILHLATHGFFLENKSDILPYKKSRGLIILGQIDSKPVMQVNNPLLRCGLAMTGANDVITARKNAKNNGILTAFEALSLNLEGTELVTLSACETGMGVIKQGEGIYGLQRSFQEAGTKNILSTLWSISDEGTKVFMKKFYTKFLNGTPAQEAIRQTQIELIHSKKWNKPFFWAPFTMVGR